MRLKFCDLPDRTGGAAPVAGGGSADGGGGTKITAFSRQLHPAGGEESISVRVRSLSDRNLAVWCKGKFDWKWCMLVKRGRLTVTGIAAKPFLLIRRACT